MTLDTFSNVMHRLLSLLVAESTLIWILHTLRPIFPVNWESLDVWVRFTPADRIVMAGMRYLALFCAYWLLASTAAYAVGLFSHLPRLVRSVEWATLPAVRMVARKALAVTLATSSFTPGAAIMLPAISVSAASEPAAAEGEGEPTEVVVTVSENGTILPPGAMVPTITEPIEGPTVSTPRPSLDEQPFIGPVATITDPPTVANPTRPLAASSAINNVAYTVVRGDNLWDISARHLATGKPGIELTDGDIASYWVQVIEVNRATIASGNPDWISPGEIIVLPPLGEQS